MRLHLIIASETAEFVYFTKCSNACYNQRGQSTPDRFLHSQNEGLSFQQIKILCRSKAGNYVQ